MRFLKYSALSIVALAAMLLLSWWWLLHTNSGARFVWGRTEVLLDGALSVRDISGDLGSGVLFSGLRYSANGVDVTADTVGFAADLDVLPLSLRLSAADIKSLHIDIGERTADEDTKAVNIGGVLQRLSLPLWLFVDDLMLRDASIEGDSLPQTIQVAELYLRGQWFDRFYVDELRIETEHDALQLKGNLQLRAPHKLQAKAHVTTTAEFVGADDRLDFDLVADGTIERVSIDAQGVAAISGFQPLDVVLLGNATSSSLELGSFNIDGVDLGASGRASLNWREQFGLSAQVAVARANINALVSAWPVARPLSGKLAIDFEPGHITLSDAQLAISGTDAQVEADITIDTATRVVAGAMNWGNLQWPINAAAPDVSSSAGSVNVSGTIDNWQVDGRVNVEAAGVDEGFFVIDGSGDRERASVMISDANVLGGRLRGSASYSWGAQRVWTAALDLAEIQTGTLAPEWPGVVSGNVRASGRLREQYLQATVRGIGGRVRERAFTADGGFEVHGRQFIAHDLTLRHGNSEFTIDGDLYAAAGLKFTAAVADLGELLPQARGAIDASGLVSLNDAGPFLKLDAKSELLAYQELHVTNLHIADGGNRGRLFNATLLADDVSIGGELIVEPSLLIDATTDTQSVTLSGTYQDFSASVQLAGAADQWNAPTQWDGELQRLVIDRAGGTKVSLDEPARLSASKSQVLLERACLSEPGGASGCTAIDWLFAERFTLSASATQVPVNLINSFRETRFAFDQYVTGNIVWRQAVGQRATGSGDISISPGTIVSRDRPGFVVETETGTIGFDINDGQLLAATLDLPMPGTGHVAGQFKVLDVLNPANSGIEGDLQFELADIAVVSVVSPLIDTATGSLQGNVGVRGNVQSPLISGDLKLADGSISYLPLGLHLDHVNLTSKLHENRRLDVEGTFMAGEGIGEIVSSAEYDGVAASGLQLELHGKNLTVINVPDVKAHADVDIRVGLANETLTLGGKIVVPYARVQPENLPSSRASVSDDVVIVAGQLPDQAAVEATPRIAMTGSVDVTLGNDVVIDLEVAKASLSGSSTFAWQGPSMPVANGRYALAGDIQAFGQVLKIVDGRVGFPNVAANNPRLRIRAEREIYGNTQVKTAGVLVAGTVARPTIEAYTFPATSEERALTLLVTGSDFNYEQGVGAVDFGTYVAPRLFVSYGVGLFGRDNVISARYDLARGFGIKATSGQKESGVDIIYRFER